MQYTGKSLQHPFKLEFKEKEYICTLNYPFHDSHVLMRHLDNNKMEWISFKKNVHNIYYQAIEYVGLPPISNGFHPVDIGIIAREFGTRRISYEGIALVYS
jgi:hypothetical protein